MFNIYTVIAIAVAFIGTIVLVIILRKSKKDVLLSKDGIEIKNIKDQDVIHSKEKVYVFTQSTVNYIVDKSVKLGRQLKQSEVVDIYLAQKSNLRCLSDAMIEEILTAITDRYSWSVSDIAFGHVKRVLGYSAFEGAERMDTILRQNHFSSMVGNAWDVFKDMKADFIFPKIQSVFLAEYDERITKVSKKDFSRENLRDVERISKSYIHTMLDMAQDIAISGEKTINMYQNKVEDIKNNTKGDKT